MSNLSCTSSCTRPETQNPTRFRQPLKARRHVHAITPRVSAVDDDVADVDTHTELDPLFLRYVGVALVHGALNLDGTAHRGDNARKLHQQPVAGDPDNSAVVLVYLGSKSSRQCVFHCSSVPSSSIPTSRL
jgi:hypothetical protein